MSDLSIVPVGFNEAIKNTEASPGAPISFSSEPMFEFYRDPDTGAISAISGLSLLASKVLYNLFYPLGSYALDTTKGSYIESLVGGTFDRATLSVELVRSVQKVEEQLLKSDSDTFINSNLDEALQRVEVLNLQFTGTDSVTISLLITSKSNKSASLRVEV